MCNNSVMGFACGRVVLSGACRKTLDAGKLSVETLPGVPVKMKMLEGFVALTAEVTS